MNSIQANTPEEGRKLRSGTAVNTANTSDIKVDTAIVAEILPACLKDAQGNLQYVPGEPIENAVGVRSLLKVALRMLHNTVNNPHRTTKEDIRELREFLDFATPRSEGFLAGYQVVVDDEVLASFLAAVKSAVKEKESGIAATLKEDSQ